jgi:Peptidase_C39 like family
MHGLGSLRAAVILTLSMSFGAGIPTTQPTPAFAPLAEWHFDRPFDRAVLTFQPRPGELASLADATPCRLWVQKDATGPWVLVAPNTKAASGGPYLDQDTVTCPTTMTALKVERPVGTPAPLAVRETHWVDAEVAPLSQSATFFGRLDVPFVPQREAGPDLASRTCSPTTVTMMLRHAGRDLTVPVIAAQVYDRTNDIYGNWSRAAWALSVNGVPAQVKHLTTAAEIDASLSAGKPVGVSIRYGAGELPGGLIRATDGHLVLIIGQAANGDFVINDPSSAAKGAGVVYPRGPFLHAMSNAGNVAYVIDR